MMKSQRTGGHDGASATSSSTGIGAASRRQRLHDLVLALIARLEDLELLEENALGLKGVGTHDPGTWIDRHRRVVLRYQALVRSAVTIDALIDQECETN